jgi:hypothetical protein
MMLTLFVAVPVMLYQVPSETALTRKLLLEVTFYQGQINALIKEQASKGGEHSPDLPIREFLRNHFLNDLMTKCPHSPVGRFLRVGASP